MDQTSRMRNVANLVNLSTPLGLAVAVASGARLRRRGSLLVADHARLGWLRASAMTVGSVVLVPGQSLASAEKAIPLLMAHEEEHAWQWAACLGLPFIPLYLLAAGWSMLVCGDRASANIFERQAGLRSGGYLERPKRGWREMITRHGRP